MPNRQLHTTTLLPSMSEGVATGHANNFLRRPASEILTKQQQSTEGKDVSPSGEVFSETFSIKDLTVTLSAEEKARGELEPKKAEQLAQYVRDYGVALLDGPVLPEEDLDNLRKWLDLATVMKVVKDGDALKSNITGGGQGLGAEGFNFSQIPRRKKWVTPGLVCNSIVEQAVVAIMGPKPFLNSALMSITNYPGSGTQELHMDGVWWKTTEEEARAVGHPWPYKVHALGVEFGVEDITPENGATEFWPGSHWVTELAPTNKFTDPKAFVIAYEEMADQRRATNPPIRMSIPKGAVCFRDKRAWHRGVTNPRDRPRHLLSVSYGSADAREDILPQSTMLRNRFDAKQAAHLSKNSGSPTHYNPLFAGPREVPFHTDCEEIFAQNPSHWGVDRNLRFEDNPKLVTPNGEDLQKKLPSLMPEAVRNVPWAREIFERERSHADKKSRL